MLKRTRCGAARVVITPPLFALHPPLFSRYLESEEQSDLVARADALVERMPNLVGIVGGLWSSRSIPIARNISTRYRLPMIAVDSWSAELTSKVDLPYVLIEGLDCSFRL